MQTLFKSHLDGNLKKNTPIKSLKLLLIVHKTLPYSYNCNSIIVTFKSKTKENVFKVKVFDTMYKIL